MRGALLLLTLLVLLHSATYVYAISDDAYISLRYAANLIDSGELAFNVGLAPVEGFSNPLFTFASALLLVMGIPALWVLRVLGLLSIAATIPLLSRLPACMLPDRSGIASLAAPALLAASSFPAFAAMTGLETALHSCLVLLATIVSMREVRGGRIKLGPLAWLAVAASRPEGALLAAAAAATQAVALNLDRRVFVRWTLGFAIPGAVLLLSRYLYFGSLLPNTYYAKVTSGEYSLWTGLGYLQSFAIGGGVWLLVPALFGYAIALRRTNVRLVALPIAVIVSQSAYAVFVGGEIMPGFRFLMPIYPLLCAGAACALAAIPQVGSLNRKAIALVLLVFVCVGAGWSQRHALATSPLRFWLLHSEPWWSYFGRSDLDGTWLHAHQTTGEFLRAQAQPGDELVVTEAGVIPFIAALPTVDLFGLTNPEVARALQSLRRAELQSADIQSAFSRIVLASQPRWIVLDGHAGPNGLQVRTPHGQTLVRSPEFQNYQPVFRAKVYSGADIGRSSDRINVVFRRSDEPLR
jgi:hypothetical protein